MLAMIKGFQKTQCIVAGSVWDYVAADRSECPC